MSRLALLAGALGALLSFAPAFAGPPDCTAPQRFLSLGAALPSGGHRLAQGKRLTILAIGSSSTAGFGASSPAGSYPSRLERDLRIAFRGAQIRVLNRGVGGQDVPEELARLERDVAQENPQLVIWQVGTNAVLRRDDIAADERLIGRGVALVRARGIDLMLMDLQYAPRVLARPGYARMEAAIAEIAAAGKTALFRRFALMEFWAKAGDPTAAPLIGRDGLHMTDASYGCLGAVLARALAAEWRPLVAARQRPRVQSAEAEPVRSGPPPD